MAKTRAPSILGGEVALLRGALFLDVAPPGKSPTATRRSKTAAAATTAGTTGAAAASSAAATSTLAAAPATATALGPPVTAATTSLRITSAADFARGERFLGRPGRPLWPLLLGQGGVPRADHMDDLGPVAIHRRLQSRLDTAILNRQHANKTCVQEGVRDSHPLLSHMVIRVF